MAGRRLRPRPRTQRQKRSRRARCAGRPAALILRCSLHPARLLAAGCRPGHAQVRGLVHAPRLHGHTLQGGWRRWLPRRCRARWRRQPRRPCPLRQGWQPVWLPSQQCRCPKALTRQRQAHSRHLLPQPGPRQPVAAARPAAPAAAAARAPRLRQRGMKVTLTFLRSRLRGPAPVHRAHFWAAMLLQAESACARRHNADQVLPDARLADRHTHPLARRGGADLRQRAAPASSRTRCRARAPMSGPTGCGPRSPAVHSAVRLREPYYS